MGTPNALPRGVFRAEPGIWFAPSSSQPGVYYQVRYGHEHGRSFSTCTCLAGQHRGEMDEAHTRACRHVRLVVEAEQDAEQATARPVGRLGDAGRFVD